VISAKSRISGGKSGGGSPPSQEPPDDLDRSIAERDETESERSRRLAADRRLIEILARENFAGERFAQFYRKLACKLSGYTWPIVMKRLSTGQIFRECERYRRPVNQLAAAYGWTYDDRLEVATDTIIDAMELFQATDD
jgi:hypothetical protein